MAKLRGSKNHSDEIIKDLTRDYGKAIDTIQELRDEIAENNEITQAIAALEEWCRKEGSRDANLEYDGEWWSVLLNEDEEDRHRNWYPKCKADVTNKSLSAAIVEAICSAVGEVE